MRRIVRGEQLLDLLLGNVGEGEANQVDRVNAGLQLLLDHVLLLMVLRSADEFVHFVFHVGVQGLHEEVVLELDTG